MEENIGRVRYLPQEKMSKEELLELLDMGQITWSSLNIKLILELALEKLINANRAEFACIFLTNEKRQIKLHNYSFAKDKMKNLNITEENSLILERLSTELLKEYKPLYRASIFNDPPLEDWFEIAKILDFNAFISLPLNPKDEVIGLVSLFFKKNYQFATHKAGLLTSVAHYLAIAIENAHLYEESRRQAEKLKSLNKKLKITNEELARKHEELEKLNKELKTLDQMKSNLLSNVSHELRTPLVAIKGYTDLILKEKIGTLNEQQKKGLQISLKSIERLISLIDNLLNFSKMEMGLEKLKLINFDLIEVAKEEVELIKSRADSRKIAITTNFPKFPVIIRGDRDKISQVFLNLLENAVKFNIHKGNIHVDISLTGNEWVMVKIADTGIGIPQKDLEKIFERFYQVDSSRSRKYGGTGIGLSIADNIIRLHGGKISVNSQVEKGSYFTFVLPVPTEKEDSLSVKAGKKFSLKGVIEVYSQKENKGKEIKTFLEEKGFGVLKTSSQSEAIYIAEKYKPELIIWFMETVDQEVLDKLNFLKENKVTSPIPLIIISEVSGIEKKYNINAEVFFSEPLYKESFIFVIDKFLSVPVYIRSSRPSALIISDRFQGDNYLNCAISHLGLIPLSTSIQIDDIKAALLYEPSVIILDIYDGEQDFINEILKFLPKDIPLIIITLSDIYSPETVENQEVFFVTRPFTLKDIQSKIQAITGSETISFRPVPAEKAPERQKTVLVVDDEMEIVNFIEMALSSEGYLIETAFSGEAALEKVEKEDFGIILLDVAMADLDGIEVCRKIKSNVKKCMTPVYIITALLTEQIKERAIEAGADGYLAKPFKINTLIETVNKVLGPVSEVKCEE